MKRWQRYFEAAEVLKGPQDARRLHDQSGGGPDKHNQNDGIIHLFGSGHSA